MKPARTMVAIAVAIALMGCGGRVPPTHYYVLEPQDVPRADPLERGLSIGVETLHVDPPYDQDRIVYRVGRDSPEVGFYAYHRWAAPLERMVPRVVASAFHGLAGLKSIEPVVPGRRYDAYLGGRVLVFEEIDTPEGQSVRIRVTLRLSVNDDEIWSDTIVGRDTLSTDDVGDIVARMQTALTAALRSARPALQLALDPRTDQ
jgi:ABC-type uncharacterized transport system auxiliary subunit